LQNVSSKADVKSINLRSSPNIKFKMLIVVSHEMSKYVDLPRLIGFTNQ